MLNLSKCLQAQPLLASYDKELLDPCLREYNEYELHCMMHAAIQCIKINPNKRPRMTQVCNSIDSTLNLCRCFFVKP
jgi:hypothetical protein